MILHPIMMSKIVHLLADNLQWMPVSTAKTFWSQKGQICFPYKDKAGVMYIELTQMKWLLVEWNIPLMLDSSFL